MPAEASGHLDTFARDNLPPESLWPEMDYGVLPELAAYPARINAGVELIDKMAQGANRLSGPRFIIGETLLSYRDLLESAGRIASVIDAIVSVSCPETACSCAPRTIPPSWPRPWRS